LIDARNIWKVYKTAHGSVEALRGVTLQAEQGELLSIVGPSGSGKSTLMAVLGCLDTPTSGSYRLDAQDVSALNDDQLAKIRNEKVGFVFQTFNLLPAYNALANVELPLLYRRGRTSQVGATLDRQERRAAAQEALLRVGLGDRMEHLPAELSGGQRQRVAIARALVQNPEILLADEPTGNLDTKVGAEILDLFTQLNEETGVTLIVVTHESAVASRTRRIVELRDGVIVSDRPSLNNAFAGRP
jgi:putative ABC transport system ATP-binding protein